MNRTLLPIPLTLVACSALALGGCGAFDNLGGGKKVSPDEFKIVSHSPLTMPPNAELRPPRPGESLPPPPRHGLTVRLSDSDGHPMMMASSLSHVTVTVTAESG